MRRSEVALEILSGMMANPNVAGVKNLEVVSKAFDLADVFLEEAKKPPEEKPDELDS